MRSDENALFSFSSNLAVGRNDPFTKLGIHRTQGDQRPTSEEQPHEETPLMRFYSCVAYVLLLGTVSFSEDVTEVEL